MSPSREPVEETSVEPVRPPAVPDRHGPHVGAVLVLLAWWGFGNLYEAIVLMPWVWGLPPGSVPGEFAAGSPVFYFVPALIALLALVWALVVRVHRDGSRRAVLRAAVLVTIAAAGTGVLVGTVNPTLRDPTATVADVHAAVVMWEIGNALRLALVVAAAVSLLRRSS
ncbi:hypothetical protein Q5530_23705 [Saccharothrix sp. BKS2]|uniref:hypothetical protein n=1 Tax=Saccharothrix sp. BKS2 TaxID=3064400 RepID=UPI0039E72EA0